MPLPLSVVAEKVPVLVPPDRLKTTVRPPVNKLFPAASFACNETTTCEPDTTLGLAALNNDCESEIGPTVTMSVGSALVIATPAMVALTRVPDPANTPVKVEEYVPSPLSRGGEKVPVLPPPDLLKAIDCPPT